MRIQEYNEPRNGDEGEKPARLPPILEFQREYRLGKERATSSSTRIRCAQKIVTQLETAPPLRPDKSWKKPSASRSPSASFFRSPLRPSNKDEKKKEKSEERKKCKPKEETPKKTSESPDSKFDKKDGKSEKNKKNKKETEKKDDPVEKKESKSEKKASKKDVKPDKKDSKNSIGAGKSETEKSERETLL